MRADIGSLDQLKASGCLTGKVGTQPVCVFWHEGRAYAIDDRCPHLGFPLHRGTVENGIVTCHWHHARFDLCTGGTLDPFADDAHTYPVEVEEGRVVVVAERGRTDVSRSYKRLQEGLEDGLSLVVAKAVLGLLEAGEPPSAIVEVGARFGCRYRSSGFGPGLTVLSAMANVLAELEPSEMALCLVQGLVFLARDTLGHAPRFPISSLEGQMPPGVDRLAGWYRRFIETRSGDAAERSLVSAIEADASESELAEMMSAAITDHVFIDEGHILDFTNKAFELVGHLGEGSARLVLPTLAHETATATRHEEESAWRHPNDLAALAAKAADKLPGVLESSGWDGRERKGPEVEAFERSGGPGRLAWAILGEDPGEIVAAILRAIPEGASGEQLGRAVALAASLRLVRFHTNNDHGDWDVVHHGFTAANALHQMLVRAPSPLLLRGVVQGALKVYLDRFLNVPAARLPKATSGSLDELGACFDTEGMVDEAGAACYGYLKAGGERRLLVAALGRRLLEEDAGFHWFQTYEAAVRQSSAWPEGSEESALVLVGAARFLAAHTPTRRELVQIVRIAQRLRRGEALYEDEDEDEGMSRLPPKNGSDIELTH